MENTWSFWIKSRKVQNIPCIVLGSSQRFVENDSHEPKKLAENHQHNLDNQNVTIEGKMQTKITAEVRQKRQQLDIIYIYVYVLLKYNLQF